jgi:hypothetical protein
MEKVLKNRFSKKFHGIFLGKWFSTEKNVRKFAQSGHPALQTNGSCGRITIYHSQNKRCYGQLVSISTLGGVKWWAVWPDWAISLANFSC